MVILQGAGVVAVPMPIGWGAMRDGENAAEREPIE
jgi:hypothetical protein